MLSAFSRSHIFILPLVVLLVVLMGEVAAYALRLQVNDPYVRTAGVMVLYGPGIALFASLTSPRLKAFLLKIRSRSRKSGGSLGISLFFLVAYGLLFWGYFLLETKGPAFFLPA